MAEWVERKLLDLGAKKEVTLETEDGWLLYANLSLPSPEDEKTVPGVILLPTALTDRKIYYNLERLFTTNGFAVLNLEYRGIGNSINKGAYIDQPYSEIMGGRRDLQEGYRFLTAQAGVDADRIGVLGSILAAKYALYGAKENPGLKAIAMLDPVVWPWDEAEDCNALESLARPLLIVTGDGMGTTTKNFTLLAAKRERNRVISFPGSIVAYLRMGDDTGLESAIVRWFRAQLCDERRVPT
jgi:alpha/beta superfamily hydrolase